MRIKQVEELVGITRKNIRFYEEQQLLQVERAENGYREYSLKDVKRLQEIKLLRKLGVPIEEIKHVFEGKESLRFCLEKQIRRLEREEEAIQNMQVFCNTLMQNTHSLQAADVDEYLEQIEKIEKGGMSFMDVHKVDVQKKRKKGALAGAMFVFLWMAFMIGIFVWGYIIDPIPGGLLLLFMAIPIVIIIGTIVALKGRLREIEGGEEDEASKY